jgi:hypothetical protein
LRYGTQHSAHSTLITVVSAPPFARFPAHLSQCVMCTKDAEEESARDHPCIESSFPLQPKDTPPTLRHPPPVSGLRHRAVRVSLTIRAAAWLVFSRGFPHDPSGSLGGVLLVRGQLVNRNRARRVAN